MLVRVTILALLPLTACQHKLIYFPRSYEPDVVAAFTAKTGKRITYRTGQGQQQAWYVPATEGPAEKLWIVCGGNGSLALEFQPVVEAAGFKHDAWILVDYPGYGECQGAPNPARIRESLAAVVPLAARESGIPMTALPAQAIVFGHSLGCAAGLLAVEEFHLKRAVLCAPFTSTMEMTRAMLGVPLGWIVYHRFNNRDGLASLRASGGRAWLTHGDADPVIPVSMSRTLADEFKDIVQYREIPRGGHNDLFERDGQSIFAAMNQARH